MQKEKVTQHCELLGPSGLSHRESPTWKTSRNLSWAPKRVLTSYLNASGYKTPLMSVALWSVLLLHSEMRHVEWDRFQKLMELVLSFSQPPAQSCQDFCFGRIEVKSHYLEIIRLKGKVALDTVGSGGFQDAGTRALMSQWGMYVCTSHAHFGEGCCRLVSGWLWLSGMGDRLNRIGSSVSWAWWLTPRLGDSSVGEVLTA